MNERYNSVIERTLFEKITESAYIGTSRVIFVFGAGHPFDLVKTRMQANPNIQSAVLLTKEIYQKTGIRGFYTGGIPNLSRTLIKEAYRSSQRGFTKSFFNSVIPDNTNKKKDLVNLLTSITMATTDTFIVCPLDRLKVWMMTNYTKEKGVSHFFKSIPESSSVSSELFRGLMPSFIRSGASWTSYLVAEEKIWQKVKELSPRVKKEDSELPLPEQILVGGLSGIVNCLCTLPFDAVKTQMQKQDVIHMHGMADTFKDIYKQYGIRGLYSGWQVKLPHYAFVGVLTSHLMHEVDKVWENKHSYSGK